MAGRGDLQDEDSITLAVSLLQDKIAEYSLTGADAKVLALEDELQALRQRARLSADKAKPEAGLTPQV